MNELDKAVMITILATTGIYIFAGSVRKICKTVYRNENGKLYRALSKKEKNLCLKLLDNCFYNIYHENTIYTKQISYNEFKFIKGLLIKGIPCFCGGVYFIEKNTPEEITDAYFTKQQKETEPKENKHIKAEYITTSAGELYKRYKKPGGGYGTEAITEAEFLANAYQEEIDRYNKIQEELKAVS